MNMLRETEDEFRQLQLREQQQLELDEQRRRLSHDATLSVNAITEEETVLPQAVMPSAPPGAEDPQFAVSPPPDVLPPSYTSVVYVDQKPSIPSRDLKPTSTSTTTSIFTTSVSTTTYVLYQSLWQFYLIIFSAQKYQCLNCEKLAGGLTDENCVVNCTYIAYS